ncbi:MAG: hypothetical protein ACLSAF_23490 [Intestinimonas sp.]
MALSRGGDQAVVKNKFNFEFYGGRSKEMEKRTKVKSRVMANALGELIADSSYVFVMGHKFPDLDCIGACAGVCAIARKRGVQARIIREPGNNPAADMVGKLSQTPEYKETFLSAQDAIILADPRTLLVVVEHQPPGAGHEPGLAGVLYQGGRHRPPSAGRLPISPTPLSTSTSPTPLPPVSWSPSCSNTSWSPPTCSRSKRRPFWRVLCWTPKTSPCVLVPVPSRRRRFSAAPGPTPEM